MKQIKSVILFLMSVVLVAFGSQDSKNPKNILKQLGDETKKVSDKIKEVKKDDNTGKTDTKKNEPKQQPVQQQPVPAVNTAQPQQPAPNTPQQQAVQQQPANADSNAQNPGAANENGFNGKKSNRRNRRNNNGLSKAPKHSRLKNSDPSTEAAPQEKPSKVKSQDSSPKSTGGSSSGSGSGSSGGSSSGGSSSGGGDSSSPE